MRTVQQALQHAPGLDVEPGPGRDLPAVISALSRGEIDAGLGRVHPADVPDGDLVHRLMRLEPVDAILGTGHPLADRDEISNLLPNGPWLSPASTRSRYRSGRAPADSGPGRPGAHQGIGRAAPHRRAAARLQPIVPLNRRATGS
jgi:DNA-binding transcriptional LysR family regulator